MVLSLIAAAGRNGVIGKNNELLWHLPDDFRFFKTMTRGHAIIMGRKTFESLKRPLPERVNIIITSDRSYKADGCHICFSVDEALQLAAKTDPEPFVIGGAEIYRQTIGLADRIYLTEVEVSLEGDAYFPPMDAKDWKETWSEHHPADERHAYAFTFKRYERV